MAAGAHFGCPKFTFGRISDHFRSIRNFFFFEISDSLVAEWGFRAWVGFRVHTSFIVDSGMWDPTDHKSD